MASEVLAFSTIFEDKKAN